MGGEFFSFNWNSIDRECQKKKNFVHFTHWDWDHINFTKKAKKRWVHLCIATLPSGQTTFKRKNWLKQSPNCLPSKPYHKWINEIPFEIKSSSKTSQNAWSRVFIVANQVLVSGDSPKKQEKRWLHLLPSNLKIHTYVLGHHGSNTSTSFQLLKKMPFLKRALASARYKKYKHPHTRVQERLKKYHINLLKTEDWGHIHIPIKY